MPPLSRLGRLFAVVAVIEAVTWAGLLVGMVLKHLTETTEAGVWLFGRLHGAAFVAYVVVALVVAVRLRWGWFRTLVALAAAVPPLATLLVERWLRRTGHLADPAARAGAPGAAPDAARASDALTDAR
jgi:integral membrane protein